MDITKDQLEKILLDANLIDASKLNEAKISAESFAKPLEEVLVAKNLLTEEKIYTAVANYFNVPLVPTKKKIIPIEVLELIPEAAARTHQIIPFEKEKRTLRVAMVDPQDFETIEFIKKKTDLKVEVYYIDSKSLRDLLGQYKKNIKNEFAKIIEENISKTKIGDELSKAAEDLPVIKVLDTIMQYSVAERASDVHIENSEDKVIIRFRIDGVLRDIISLDKDISPALIARVKILSNLKIDEHRQPQDGRFKYSEDEYEISIRVSIIPSFYGENVVMRLLFESERPRSLVELGITGRNAEIITNSITKAHGMILVTGPTGSGKTTTLYSVLNMLNSTEVKICTVEDPIEYGMSRISQIQVNPQTGLTFAAGLRALLRHDPDIIMVGEIRDAETANIAIHSALTGHLVLSTLHTNDAPSAIPRFIDMGAEPFLVASTVNVVIAQRLVRKICEHCRVEVKPNKEIIKEFATSSNIKEMVLLKQKYYQGKGCVECGDSGYKGRVGIYEIFEMNDDIRGLVLKKAAVGEIRAMAEKKGMTSLVEDGVIKIGQGMTTIEEVLRVTKE
jgi:type IV pilus assembly protein PilB